MAKTEIIGSWYNTGYHGHFRSKSRSDFMNEFRHLAKPIPPKKFNNRSQQPVRKHVFSLHDNRNSFTTDALYFEQGLGRKRFKEAKFAFQPNFLSWMPQKSELEKVGPKSSVYKVDFRGIPREPIKQQIVKRPKTTFDEEYKKVTTSYRYAHGDDNPNKDILDAMCNDGLSKVTRKKMGSSMSGRESVASCMSWYIPQPPRKPTVPAGTQTLPTRKLAPAATEIVVPSSPLATTAPAALETTPESTNLPPVTTQTLQTEALAV